MALPSPSVRPSALNVASVEGGVDVVLVTPLMRIRRAREPLSEFQFPPDPSVRNSPAIFQYGSLSSVSSCVVP